MSAPPAIRGISEREFQAAVIDLAERVDWVTAHFHDSRRQVRRSNGESAWIGDRSAAGFPDLVLVRGPRLIFAELKAEKGRLSEAQRQWLQALEMAGAEVYVWRPSAWDEIVAVLTRREAS